MPLAGVTCSMLNQARIRDLLYVFQRVMVRSLGNHRAQCGSRKKRAIIVKMCERAMVALSKRVYQARYKEEGKDTESSLMAPEACLWPLCSVKEPRQNP